MKKLLARIAALALLLAVACFAQACADDLSFGKTQIAHGESVVITYDLSGYTFDAAELVPIADFNHSNSPRQARYELDKIPLTGKTGSVTFTQTSIGDRIGFQICLRTSDGSPDWREWPESDFFYGGDITFTDAWNTPVPPAMAVQYHQASVPARTPISADYQITPGSSPIDCLEVGWAVYDDQGFAASVLNPEDAPLSGTVVMEDPTWKATHYVMASLQTADGWIYDMEDGDTGIEVTTDATGSPLSIELSWKDENGRTLDWNTDRPVSGQLLLMSYRLRGGYTAYDGYVSLIPVSGSTDFGAKGYAGEARTMDFHIFGTTDLVLDLEYSDGRSSQTLQVTVPAPAVPPLQLTAGRDPNIYLGMPVYYGGLGADASLTHGAIECLWVEIQQYSVLQNAYGGEPRWSYSVPANAPLYRDGNSHVGEQLQSVAQHGSALRADGRAGDLHLLLGRRDRLRHGHHALCEPAKRHCPDRQRLSHRCAPEGRRHLHHRPRSRPRGMEHPGLAPSRGGVRRADERLRHA